MDGQDCEEDADIVILDVADRKFELQFRPLAISSGSLFVGDLRNRAADKLSTKAGTVRLMYNGQELNEDDRTARYYGLQRNSTVLCTFGDISGNIQSRESYNYGFVAAKEAVDELNFIGYSVDWAVRRSAESPIVSSHDASSLEGSEHGLELSSNHNTTKSGAASTALTSVEADLDHETVADEMESVTDDETPENVFKSMGYHLYDNNSRYQSADMSEDSNARQDFSIAFCDASALNCTKFFIRLVDISLFLETEIIKLVAVPDYRAAQYMIFDWYDASTPASSWTTKKNVGHRTLGGRFGKIAEVLRRAIATTSAFGIRYMWLPTICLITDDAADIKRQHPSMDGIFSYAVALLKAPGGVNHQYIEAKIVQHRIRVIELPEAKNSSSTQAVSQEYALARYMASRDEPWTPYTHYSPIDCFWSASRKCLVLEQLEALLQDGRTSLPAPQAPLPYKPRVAYLDAQRDGGKLIGIAFYTGNEVSKARVQPVSDPRAGPLACLPKNKQVPRYENNPAPQTVACPASGVKEQSVHIGMNQQNRTNQNSTSKGQSSDDLSKDESAYARTDTVSRKRKRQHGCAMKCPWSFERSAQMALVVRDMFANVNGILVSKTSKE